MMGPIVINWFGGKKITIWDIVMIFGNVWYLGYRNQYRSDINIFTVWYRNDIWIYLDTLKSFLTRCTMWDGHQFPRTSFRHTLLVQQNFAVFGEAQLGRWLTSLAAEFGIWCAILLRRSAQKTTREVARSIPTEIQCPSWSRTSNWTFSAVSCKQDFTNMKKKYPLVI